MKLANQQRQNEAFRHLYGDNDSKEYNNTDISVRIYASGKKAKRGIKAMQRNGWAYCKPTICQVAALPMKNRLRRRKGSITGALPRMVVFYRR